MVIVLGDDKEAPIVDRELCKSFTLLLLVLTLVELKSFTARKRMCGKVILLHPSICHSVQKGVYPSMRWTGGVHP